MNTLTTKRWSFERVTTIILQLLIVVVIIFQTLSLFSFPQPDGARWWGDETTQMLELKTELTTGYAHIPTGLGSSVAITNGIVRSNSWMAAIVYGLPALIISTFTSQKDLVETGRLITLLLSIALISIMSRMLFALNVPTPLRLGAVLLLITTRSFFFASHAARLDVAAGLTVLAFAWYLSNQYTRIQRREWTPTPRWYFLYGAAAMLFATLSIHLLTLLGLLSIYALLRFGAFRNLSSLLSAIAGVAFVCALLLSMYALSGAPWTLFGPTAKPNQFQAVTSMLPIQRPFSRSVQVGNILERMRGLWSEAPAFMLLCIGALLRAFLAVRHHWRTYAQGIPQVTFLSGSAFTILVAWLLFQSPALYYYIHVLPLFIVALVVYLAPKIETNKQLFATIAVFSFILSIASVADSIQAGKVSQTITHANRQALLGILDTIDTTSTRSHPIVLAQNPAISFLEQRSDVRLMTAHIVSFPLSGNPLAISIQKLGVKYILLYASHTGKVYSDDYATLRPLADSIGRLVRKSTGTYFDDYRNYFSAQSLQALPNDTLLLYELPQPIVR